MALRRKRGIDPKSVVTVSVQISIRTPQGEVESRFETFDVDIGGMCKPSPKILNRILYGVSLTLKAALHMGGGIVIWGPRQVWVNGVLQPPSNERARARRPTP